MEDDKRDPARNVTKFSLKLDEAETERFLKLLSDGGIMRAGFVMHQANNSNITVELHANPPKKKE